MKLKEILITIFKILLVLTLIGVGAYIIYYLGLFNYL